MTRCSANDDFREEANGALQLLRFGEPRGEDVGIDLFVAKGKLLPDESEAVDDRLERDGVGAGDAPDGELLLGRRLVVHHNVLGAESLRMRDDRCRGEGGSESS